ncbi:MAG: ferrous iron transport protein A [Sphingobium sp.]|nr:ferrous iron transport protein A [Sphingobium sp.]
MHLHQLSSGQSATIDRIEWNHLSDSEGQRLREFGVEEGADIEILHRAGLLGQGAIMCRIGRMSIAMRHNHADAIHVRQEHGQAGPNIAGPDMNADTPRILSQP